MSEAAKRWKERRVDGAMESIMHRLWDRSGRTIPKPSQSAKKTLEMAAVTTPVVVSWIAH
jgi:hypothetical protein